MKLRNGKAAGPHEIPAEAFKADMETATNMLHSLFSKIWKKEEVPAQWKEGIVIKLPKKGDLRDCNNYRGIVFLSVPGKELSRVLLERMKEAVDPKLRDQQAGFRRNRSCADQIASLRIIVEQSLEWHSPPLHQLHRLWEGLRQCGQRDAVEAAEALWSPREDHRSHPLYLPWHELQDRSRLPAVRKRRGQDWSPARVPAVTISLPSGHRLDHEDHHNRQMTWCSCHTSTDRCRTGPPAWRSYQLGQGSRSARRKQSWWRLTPLPTHH